MLLLAAASGSLAGPPEVVVRRIAVHGDHAPGTPPGVTFFNTFFETNFPSPPLIDSAGNVSFHAILTGPGVVPLIFTGNSEALYKHVGGELVPIARQAEPAPGTAPGVAFQGFPLGLGPTSASIAAGRTVFLGTVFGPGITEQTQAGLWTDRSGTVALFIRAGDPVPGAPAGSTLLGAPLATIDPAGRIAFHASFRAPGQPLGLFVPSNEGIWSDRSGTLERLVGGGDPAPGAGPGVTFGQGAFFAIDGALRGWDLDASGRVSFHGNLSGPGINDLNDEGIWVERPAGLQLLIREGDGAPGFGPGGRIGIVSGIDAFGSRFPVDVNDAGQLLFMARVDPPGQGSFTEAAYALRGTSLELVAEARDSSALEPGPQAPGLPPGMYFRALLWGNLSNSGRVVLVAATTNHGGTILGSGIWWDQPGPLTMLAADGVQVPGFAPGVVYLGNFQIGPITGAGTLLFAGAVGGPGFPASTVIFLTDATGVPHAVLRPGQEINTAPAGSPPELRTLSGFLIGGMSESGEVAFKALFTDNTIAVMTVSIAAPCYPDCNGDGALTVADFGCFQTKFVAMDSYADCNEDLAFTVADFGCFQTAFVQGCP